MIPTLPPPVPAPAVCSGGRGEKEGEGAEGARAGGEEEVEKSVKTKKGERGGGDRRAETWRQTGWSGRSAAVGSGQHWLCERDISDGETPPRPRRHCRGTGTRRCLLRPSAGHHVYANVLYIGKYRGNEVPSIRPFTSAFFQGRQVPADWTRPGRSPGTKNRNRTNAKRATRLDNGVRALPGHDRAPLHTVDYTCMG